jgi:hypothetical protein
MRKLVYDAELTVITGVPVAAWTGLMEVNPLSIKHITKSDNNHD